MMHENFISYLSTGQDSFNCEFKVDKAEQIEVIVEDKRLKYLEDYIIENFNEKIKVIKLKEKLGSSLYPKLIILKKDAYIHRQTNFQDNSQIKANLLNLEFDNIINNQAYLKDFLIALSRGLLIKDDEETEGGGDGETDGGNGEDGGDGETGGGSENSNELDPRNWEEVVNIVDIEDYFDVIDFKEIVVPDIKPFTHNTYIIYASNPDNFPDSTPYRFTNLTKITEPCSIKFFIDKRICLKSDATNNFQRKIFLFLNVGGMYPEFFNIYATDKEVIYHDYCEGKVILNGYPDVFNNLQINLNDQFIMVEKYF
ncbi:MAG: hypothetical protein LBH40_04215 [Alphaproteobacteria bacterium]|jgi:hypothetical protein|nr:hypothetical protein [Alphaproteobacteria bacterium]